MESLRFGIDSWANELNPVASVILEGTLRFPMVFGSGFLEVLQRWGNMWAERLKGRLSSLYARDVRGAIRNNIYAHTVRCPQTKKWFPLLPNLWLQKGESPVAVRVVAESDMEEAEFEIVEGKEIDFDPRVGTVRRGKGLSPWTGEVVEGSYIKGEAQAGRMGRVLYAVVVKDGKRKSFRLPDAEDFKYLEASYAALREWEDGDRFVPDTEVPKGEKTPDLLRYGISRWRDRFLPRQLLAILFGIEEIKRLEPEVPEEYSKAVTTYLAMVISKMVSYNSVGSRWEPNRGGTASCFERHDFGFKWSFSEMPMTDGAQGVDWVLGQVLDAYIGIAKLLDVGHGLYQTDLSHGASSDRLTITQGDGADLEATSKSVTAVVVDPPYYDNVQYAELSDFFYVWMRLTLKEVYPDWFLEQLTEKDREAVKNKSRFVDIDPTRAEQMARDDYERKMTRIFKEAYRVLRDDGVMTVMFNHKELDAWDTLAMSLIEAGFEVVSSWPIHTESQHSLHQANKAASASTILLSCRKRAEGDNSGSVLWDDIRGELREEVNSKIVELRSGWSGSFGEDDGAVGQQNGNGNGNGLHRVDGVDLFIAVFGPALSVISRRWPVVLSELDPVTHRAKVLSPGMALDFAREVIVESRLGELFGRGGYRGDPVSDWYVIGWSVFGAREFPFDEANKMAKTLKLEVADLVKAGLVEKKGSKVLLVSPKDRLAGLKKTADELEPGSLADYAQGLMAAALDRGVTGVDRVISRIEQTFSQDDRFSRSNTERYLQALVYSVPRVRDKDKNFELVEAEALDLVGLGPFFNLQYPPMPETIVKAEQNELDLDDSK